MASDRLRELVDQVAELISNGCQVMLVTSGAIAAGVEGLGLVERPKAIRKLQAAASVGQGLLNHQYSELFAEHGLRVGQVLLTQQDFSARQQYLNARNTLETLLELGVVPVINENDTTAVDEIKFGDNDTLAALVTNMIHADTLIILTDTEGFCTSDPQSGAEVCILEEVTEITPEIEALAGGAGTPFGSGGMATKLEAAKIVTAAGHALVIAPGFRPKVLLKVAAGEKIGTFFVPHDKKVSSRKLWMAFGKIPQGRIVIDAGAKEALTRRGKSLLPAGVLDCDGDFQVGDTVEVISESGEIFARGVTSLSAKELKRVRGLKSSEVRRLLPEAMDEEVIHRDELLVLNDNR